MPATITGRLALAAGTALASAITATSAFAADAHGSVAFAQYNFGNGWWETQAEGVEAKLTELGYEVRTVSAQGDSVKQNSQVRTFITQQFDGVIMNPTDPQGVEPSLTALQEADIPVVTVNSPLQDALLKYVYCYVSGDQMLNATRIGAEMGRVLAEKFGPNKSVKFLMVAGIPGDLNTIKRRDGFFGGYKSIDGAPKLNQLETVYGHWRSDAVVAPVRSIATANPDLEALFVQTDSMIPGVKAALEAADLWNDVIIAGYDARMSIVEQMANNPDGPIMATVANRPYEQGQVGAEMVHKAVTGVPQGEACPGGQHVIKPVLVTPENAKSYYVEDRPY